MTAPPLPIASPNLPPEEKAVGLGDPPIAGVAQPKDLSNASLIEWVKDAANPITINHDKFPTAKMRYSGPSNLCRPHGPQDPRINMAMILGGTTGLFQTTDPKLQAWALLDPSFYPKRGGGGGLFFPLPRDTRSRSRSDNSSYTPHMLQPDCHGDGTSIASGERCESVAEKRSKQRTTAYTGLLWP
jgi:hypothetical protein